MDGRITYTVKKEDEGLSLGRLARQRMAVSASLLRQIKWIPGGILLDGQEAYTNALPSAGQVISLACGRDMGSENIIPQDGTVEVAYEDELMLVVDKPGGMAVHPSPGHPYGTLANYIAGMFRRRGESIVFHAINRLDRGTSGLMCVAKTKYSAALLGAALDRGDIRRSYYAVCLGAPQPPSGTIDAPIGRCEGYGIKRCVAPGGQHAVTHYRTAASNRRYSLVELELETGRTHQIRVHMAHIGCPLAGDFMYGEEIAGFDRVALHSRSIDIILPDRRVHAETPSPPCFSQFVDL